MDKLTIIGNLGQDPEMRYTPAGKPVANFSVASNRKWTGADGEKHEQTTWYRISAWNKLAEICNQYLQKGRQVYIEGELRPDENGGPRACTTAARGARGVTQDRRPGEPGQRYPASSHKKSRSVSTPQEAS